MMNPDAVSIYSHDMFWIFVLIAIAVPTVWWWVQRPMLNRRTAYGVNVALIALGLFLMWCPWGVWPEMEFGGFYLAFFAFFSMMFMLGSEGVNMPECRRRAIEAALPARPVDCIKLPCCLSAEQMVAGFNQHMIAITSSADGSLDGAYEDDYHDWSGRLLPLEGEGWVLQLWANGSDYLRDLELTAICEKHRLPIKSVLMGTRMDALCVCRAGQVLIFPADAKEDAIFFLSLFDSCFDDDNSDPIY